MSNTFFVYLPSNVSDYPSNQPNKFRVRLQKSLSFNNGTWVCGLHSINYPYSWPSTIGTLDDQWINIHYDDKKANKQRVLRVPVPKASHTKVEKLREFLSTTLQHQIDNLESVSKSGYTFVERPKLLHSPPPADNRRKRSAQSPPRAGLKSPPHAEIPRNLQSPPLVVEGNEQKKRSKSSDDLAPRITETTSENGKKTSELGTVTKEKDNRETVLQTLGLVETGKETTSDVTKKSEERKDLLDILIGPKTKDGEKNRGEKFLQEIGLTEPPKVSIPTPKEPPAAPTQPKLEPPVKQPQPVAKQPKSEQPAAQTKSESSDKHIQSKAVQQMSKQSISESQKASVSTKTEPPKAGVTRPVEPPSSTSAPTPGHKATTDVQPTKAEKIHSPAPRTDSIDAIFGSTSKKADKTDDIITNIFGKTPNEGEKSRAEELLTILFGDEDEHQDWAKNSNLDQLKKIIGSVEIEYHKDFERFKAVFTDPHIKYLSFSPQLGYVLGFQDPQSVQNNEIAKYGCDLRGGFSSFAVYSNGLTENMIVGNSMSSILRVVSIADARPGEYNEKIYDSPIYCRVMPLEVKEIEIELRTMDKGRHVPFAWGTVMVVLMFKKVINF